MNGVGLCLLGSVCFKTSNLQTWGEKLEELEWSGPAGQAGSEGGCLVGVVRVGREVG